MVISRFSSNPFFQATLKGKENVFNGKVIMNPLFFGFSIFRKRLQLVALKDQLETNQYCSQEPRKTGLSWPVYMYVHMHTHTHAQSLSKELLKWTISEGLISCRERSLIEENLAFITRLKDGLLLGIRQ